MREYLKKARARAKANGGFTLIELMAVLAILALIAIIAVPAIGGIIGNAESQSNASTVEMVEKAAEVAYVADGTEGKSAYTVDQLISGGFLDLDYSTIPEITGDDSVTKDGSASTFTYSTHGFTAEQLGETAGE